MSYNWYVIYLITPVIRRNKLRKGHSMRLFTAIRFSDEIKDTLDITARKLRSCSVSGNFTHRSNFHLTLVFIGETDDTAPIKCIMDRLNFPPFEIALGGLGVFKRSGGDIWWEGVAKNPTLSELQRQLSVGLKTAGYKIESGEYKPHLTLGREVILKPGFDRAEFTSNIPISVFEVKDVSLMRSDRVNGTMRYTELYTKPLI